MINIIERAVILSQGSHLHIDLPDELYPEVETTTTTQLQTPAKEFLTDQDRQQQERDNIIAALRVSKGIRFRRSRRTTRRKTNNVDLADQTLRHRQTADALIYFYRKRNG